MMLTDVLENYFYYKKLIIQDLYLDIKHDIYKACYL